GAAAVFRTIDECATAEDALHACGWTCGIGLGIFWVIGEPVGAPLENVAYGVVHSPGVGGELGEGGGEFVAGDPGEWGEEGEAIFGGLVAGVAAPEAADGIVAPWVGSLAAGAGAVFPLGFGGKMAGAIFFSAEPVAEGSGVEPIDADDGIAGSLGEAGV